MHDPITPLINISDFTDEQLQQELDRRKKEKDLSNTLKKLEANPLRSMTVTRIAVGYSDFERFIKTVWGKVYESASVEEANNDTEKSYNVKGLDLNTEFDKVYGMQHYKEIEEFLYGDSKKEPPMSYLLNYLADRGCISKGEYTIRWSW